MVVQQLAFLFKQIPEVPAQLRGIARAKLDLGKADDGLWELHGFLLDFRSDPIKILIHWLPFL
jgi:hypothetical protein